MKKKLEPVPGRVIDECISFQLNRAAQQASRRARELLLPLSVTPTQYAVLSVLAEEDGRTQSEVGDRLSLDSATMTGLVDRLEKQGLVERRADNSDRRAQRVWLTPAGRAGFPAMLRAMQDLNGEVDALLGRAAPTLRRALKTIARGN